MGIVCLFMEAPQPEAEVYESNRWNIRSSNVSFAGVQGRLMDV